MLSCPAVIVLKFSRLLEPGLPFSLCTGPRPQTMPLASPTRETRTCAPRCLRFPAARLHLPILVSELWVSQGDDPHAQSPSPAPAVEEGRGGHQTLPLGLISYVLREEERTGKGRGQPSCYRSRVLESQATGTGVQLRSHPDTRTPSRPWTSRPSFSWSRGCSRRPRGVGEEDSHKHRARLLPSGGRVRLGTWIPLEEGSHASHLPDGQTEVHLIR